MARRLANGNYGCGVGQNRFEAGGISKSTILPPFKVVGQ